MRHRIAASILVFLFALSGPALADDEDWIGLYKGLDALDGSINYMSISSTGPGTFEIRTVLTVISLCEGGSGWIVGQGRVSDDDTLMRHDARVFCRGEEPFSLKDMTFLRDDDTDVISIDAPDDGRALIYHRISDD